MAIDTSIKGGVEVNGILVFEDKQGIRIVIPMLDALSADIILSFEEAEFLIGVIHNKLNAR